MSILDVFTILVKSDAKQTEKDFDSLDKKTKKTQDSIDKTSKTTKDLGSNFGDFVKALVTASGIDFTIKGLANAASGVNSMEVGLGRLSKLTGVLPGDIDALDQALQRIGAPAGSGQAFFEGINKFYQSKGRGDLVKDVLPSIIALSAQWKDLNINTKQYFEDIYGLTPDIILLMDQYGDKLGENLDKIKETRNLTKENTEAATALNKAWLDAGSAFVGFYNDAVPALTWLGKATEVLVDVLRSAYAFYADIFTRDHNFSHTEKLWSGFMKENANDAGAKKSSSGILSLISKYESGDRNIPNESGPGGTPASTASGYYQIINETWRKFAAQAGLSQYPTAMSAPFDAQTKVASLLYDQQGLEPWASDARLMAAVASQRTGDGSSFNGILPSGNKTANVNVGDITINTQAKDAHGIANDIGNELSTQLRNTVGSFDDSMVR